MDQNFPDVNNCTKTRKMMTNLPFVFDFALDFFTQFHITKKKCPKTSVFARFEENFRSRDPGLSFPGHRDQEMCPGSRDFPVPGFPGANPSWNIPS